MYCFNHEGVKVFQVMTTRVDGNQVILDGCALRESGNTYKPLVWSAWPTAQGWWVEITGKGSFQGSTFCLPIEVAAAIRRVC